MSEYDGSGFSEETRQIEKVLRTFESKTRFPEEQTEEESDKLACGVSGRDKRIETGQLW